MEKKTVRDVPVEAKRVLVRVDFNVPQDKKGNITDDTRLRESLPTIRYLLEHKAKTILCSHLGRPEGKVDAIYSLAPVGKRLSELLGQPVLTAKDCIGPEAEEAVAKLKVGQVLLLENLRFHKEEEENSPAFAQALARLGEIFVNDAFGTTHRAHASVVGVTRYLPAVAGFLLEKEINALGKALDNPVRPLAAIVGGAKVSDKIAILEHILSKVNILLVGGGMANTFLRAQGYNLGHSLVEEDRLDFARGLLAEAKKRGVTLLLPVDVVAAPTLDGGAEAKSVAVAKVPSDWQVGDIGPETVKLFGEQLRKSGTVIWNGPVGAFELSAFSKGTQEIARLLATLDKAITVVGGGSTAEAVEAMGLASKMTHVSTGGGASLRFLEGKTLPGVAALQDKLT